MTTKNDCMICNKFRRKLLELKKSGEFRYQTEPLTTEDLYAKYMIGNPENKNLKSYIDDFKVCPECKSNDVMTKFDFFPTRHYHICNKCGWKSSWVSGEDFETLGEKRLKIEV